MNEVMRSEDERRYHEMMRAAAQLPSSEFERVKDKIIAEQTAKKEAAVRRGMYDHLLDAFRYGQQGDWNRATIRGDMTTIGDLIREKIEHHKNIIASLEWFASHLSLDAPEEHLFVNRVIMEGLRALSERNSPDVRMGP